MGDRAEGERKARWRNATRVHQRDLDSRQRILTDCMELADEEIRDALVADATTRAALAAVVVSSPATPAEEDEYGDWNGIEEVAWNLPHRALVDGLPLSAEQRAAVHAALNDNYQHGHEDGVEETESLANIGRLAEGGRDLIREGLARRYRDAQSTPLQLTADDQDAVADLLASALPATPAETGRDWHSDFSATSSGLPASPATPNGQGCGCRAHDGSHAYCYDSCGQAGCGYLAGTNSPRAPSPASPAETGLLRDLTGLEHGYYQQMLDRDGADRLQYLARALAELGYERRT